MNTFPLLAAMATTHFINIYKAPPNDTLVEIMRTTQLFPRFVDQEEALDLEKEVIPEELEAILNWFKRDKIPGPDGWNVEFYLAFFDVLGGDLLQVIEECRSIGRMYEAFNSTCTAFIPKSYIPSSFYDFHPISLCNFIYKIIAKIIANCLRPIIYIHISSKQFAFLQDRQIHEAIGTAQEVMHSIQSKNIKGMIIKADLSKAFDRVS